MDVGASETARFLKYRGSDDEADMPAEDVSETEEELQVAPSAASIARLRAIRGPRRNIPRRQQTAAASRWLGQPQGTASAHEGGSARQVRLADTYGTVMPLMFACPHVIQNTHSDHVALLSFKVASQGKFCSH